MPDIEPTLYYTLQNLTEIIEEDSDIESEIDDTVYIHVFECCEYFKVEHDFGVLMVLNYIENVTLLISEQTIYMAQLGFIHIYSLTSFTEFLQNLGYQFNITEHECTCI